MERSSGGRFPRRRTEGGQGGQGGYRSGGMNAGRGREGYEAKGRFIRKKVCRLCAERVATLDFKDVERLLKFLTEKGKILPQRITGNCAKHQRMLARATKRARHATLIPFQIGS